VRADDRLEDRLFDQRALWPIAERTRDSADPPAIAHGVR
jgi:hypothetical protein